MNYSIRLADIFHEISNFTGTPLERNLLFRGKAYDILLAQIREYRDIEHRESKQSLMCKRELVRVQKAVKILNENIANFVSVKDLSRRVGLNPNKLQNGFKQVYHTTINGYVQERRLYSGGILIRNSDLTFTQIADRVGINSKSYFSLIFKDRYGLTPSEIRAGRRNKK